LRREVIRYRKEGRVGEEGVEQFYAMNKEARLWGK
jgi:hypothetical protein